VNFKKIIELSYALLPTHGDYRCRHASFIIYKDKIMSIGINNPNKTHPKNLKFGYRNKRNEPINEIIGIHSELAAVIKFGRQTLQDLDMVNTRIDRNNMLALAKPCIGCQDMLKQLGINRIFFSNNQSRFEQLYF
jgi:deoxycytidylate deaminase